MRIRTFPVRPEPWKDPRPAVDTGTSFSYMVIFLTRASAVTLYPNRLSCPSGTALILALHYGTTLLSAHAPFALLFCLSVPVYRQPFPAKRVFRCSRPAAYTTQHTAALVCWGLGPSSWPSSPLSIRLGAQRVKSASDTRALTLSLRLDTGRPNAPHKRRLLPQ